MPEVLDPPTSAMPRQAFADVPDEQSNMPKGVFDDLPEERSNMPKGVFNDLPAEKPETAKKEPPASRFMPVKPLVGALPPVGEPTESIVGISPEIVPAGKGPATSILSAVGKMGAGVAGYMTSPQGMAESALALVPPATPFVLGKWAYDMAKGAKLEGEALLDEIGSTLRDWINRGIISNKNLGLDDKASAAETQDHIQALAEHTVNLGAMGVGALTTAGHALKAGGKLAAPLVTPRPETLAARAMSDEIQRHLATERPIIPLTASAVERLPDIEAAAIAGGEPTGRRIEAGTEAGPPQGPEPSWKQPILPKVPPSRVAGSEFRPTVPETAAEAQRDVTVLEEIRNAGAKTIGQIQQLFPKAEMNRERARALRDAAWPEQAKAHQETEARIKELLKEKGPEDAIQPETAQPVRLVREPSGKGVPEVPVEGKVPSDDEGRGKAPAAPEKPTVVRPPGVKPDATEWIESAAYQDEQGTHTGAHHPAALEQAGGKELAAKYPTRESRNTPQFGYKTNLRSFVSRAEAAPIAEKAGQKLEAFDVDEQGKPAPHSDQVKSPVEPGKALGDVPQETKTETSWDAFNEELRGDLDSFSPARATGKVDYDLMDVADRFVQWAKGQPRTDKLSSLVRDFWDSEQGQETKAIHINKLRKSLKSLEGQGISPFPSEKPPAAAAGGPKPVKPQPSVESIPELRRKLFSGVDQMYTEYLKRATPEELWEKHELATGVLARKDLSPNDKRDIEAFQTVLRKALAKETEKRTGLKSSIRDWDYMGPGQGWPREGDLQLGEKVKTPDGEVATVVESWRTATAKEIDGKPNVTLKYKNGYRYTFVGNEVKALQRIGEPATPSDVPPKPSKPTTLVPFQYGDRVEHQGRTGTVIQTFPTNATIHFDDGHIENIKGKDFKALTFAAQPPAKGTEFPPAPPPTPVKPTIAPEIANKRGPQGNVSWTSSTPLSNEKVSGTWEVLDAGDPVTSNDPGYDQDLQPRDRSRVASKEQIAEMARKHEPERLVHSPTTDLGAPIVDDLNQVLSGNGRMAALRAVYAEGGEKANAYRHHIEQEAAKLGIPPDKFKGIQSPVLVRRIQDYGGLSKTEFTRKSNEQQVLGMSDAEKAGRDAAMLRENPGLLDSFLPSEEGDVLAASNRGFLNSFIEGTGDRADLISADGSYNAKKLIPRVKNAVLGALLGHENRRLLNDLIDRAEELNIKKPVTGVMNAAPRLMKFRGTNYDLASTLGQAFSDLVRIKGEGMKLGEFLDQDQLFRDPQRSAESDFLLSRLAEARSAKDIAEGLARYAELAGKIDLTTGDIFGGEPTPRPELLKRAYAEPTVPKEEQPGLALGKPPQPPPEPEGPSGAAGPGVPPTGPKPTAPAAPEVKPEPAPPKPIFKPEEQKRIDEIKALLKKKFGDIDRGKTLMGLPLEPFDAELFKLGGELAYHYMKAGVRRFGDFASHMISELGDAAKKYLLSWYSNAKLQLKEHANEFDTDTDAKRIYDQRFQPANARRPAVPGGVGGGGGAGGRPGVRVAREELIPQPKQYVGIGGYEARSGFRLNEEQVRGINLILDWFNKNPERGAHLLGDGPGFGKTAQELAVADQYRKQGLGERILIVTQNKQVAETRFKADAARMGIDPNIFTLTTFTSLKNLTQRDWDLVIYDEAHNLKNGSAQKSMAAARLRAKHELFATATPMDRPTGAAYFLSKITGKDYLQIARELGYTFQQREDPLTREIHEYAVPLPGMNWQKIWNNIMAHRDAAVSAGAMIRREYPFYGEVNTHNLPMEFDSKMEQERLIKYYDNLIERARTPTAKRNYAGQKTLTLSRWSEQRKLKAAVDMAEEHLKKGGQVIIVAETDKRQSFPQPIAGSEPGPPDEYGRPRWYVDGAITQLNRMLAERGITDIADIHDPTKNTIALEVGKFQRGEDRVALATPQSGGTGIDLDDVKGDRPRLMIALSKNFAGDTFEQLVGRVSRMNTASPAEVRFLNLRDSFADERRNDVLDKKVRTLKAIQGGEEVDVAGGFDPNAGIKGGGGGGSAPFMEPEAAAPPEAQAEQPPAPAEGEVQLGSGGTVRTPTQPSAPTPVAATPEEAQTIQRSRIPGLETLRSISKGIKSLLLPAAIDKEHLRAAEILGSKLGPMHRDSESAAVALRKDTRRFDRMGVHREGVDPHNNPGMKFMSDMSQGRELTGKDRETANTVQRLFKDRLEKLAAADAPLEKVRENYFPGMWTKESRLAFNLAVEQAMKEGILGRGTDLNLATDAQKAWIKERVGELLKQGRGSERDALQYLAKRPIKGRESFRKPKVFDDIMTGAELGLEPISNNPMDLVKLKLAEMDRSIMANRYFQELKAIGDHRVINPYSQVPQGWVKINDKYGTIYGPPTVEEREFVDKNVYDGLMNVARGLGISPKRVFRAGRGRLGYASTTGETVSQFATELSVLAHELGHQLDFRYGLWDRIVKGDRPGERGTIQDELRALADLSWEGRDPAEVSEYYKRQVRKKREKMAHLLEAYIHAPDKFKQVAPTVYNAFDGFIKSKPELRALSEIKPGISLERLDNERYVGMRIMGYRIVPEAHGRIMNNYLSSSLYNSPYFGKLYTGWMEMANTLNQSQLGVGSFFHAGFTTMEAQISANANVLKDIYGVARGNRMLSDLGKSAKQAAVATVRTGFVGDEVLNAWRHPDGRIDPRIAQVVKAMELGGAGARLEKGMQTRQYEKTYRDWYSKHKLRAAMRSPVAMLELMAKPVMDFIVPRQKAGVFADMAWRIIDQHPDTPLEELTPQFRQAWNRIDARLGQVQYDRLFMNNVAKNVVQATVRAPGWSGGTIAELGGAFPDAVKFLSEWVKTGKAPENIPDRTAYALSLILTVGAVNGALTYAFTGQKPTGLDYVAFRTGRKDENGNEERFLLPTYMKDLLAYARETGRTLVNKSHPVISLVGDVIRGRDYYGTEIRSPDDSKLAQVGETAKYVLKSFEPFWTRGARKATERGAGPLEIAGPFVGVMPAPANIANTEAEKLASELIRAQLPQGARTREQFERTQKERRAVQAIKSGRMTSTEAVDQGLVPVQRQRMIERRAEMPYLEYAVRRLSIESAIRVYQKANEAERKRLRDIVESKLNDARSLSQERKEQLRQKLETLK